MSQARPDRAPPGASPVRGSDPGDRSDLAGRVARWWLPERWAFVDELPKTSVGKFDKKALRSQVADGSIEIPEALRRHFGADRIG